MTKNTEFSYIGKRIKRTDARGKVTGDTRYLTDMTDGDLLYAAPVTSTIPYGVIRHIDISEAESHPDFMRFITHEDIPGENQVGVILSDQPLFAEKIVRYVGDSIGLMVARTEQAALDLAAKVKVEYDPLPPVFTIDESRDADRYFLHETNVACTHRVIRGDIQKGFDEAHTVVEAEFETGPQEHYYLEPQGCIVRPLNDEVRVIGSLQCPFYVQKAIAKVLGWPFSRVIVEQAPTGGAFGGKEDVPSEVCARTALASVLLNRPVKMVYSRRDDIQLTSKRHPFKMHYRIGVDETGKIITAQVKLEENSGAYATLSSVVSYRSSIQALGPYQIPNVSVESVSYYTNLPPNGAFRGFGSPQATFGHERMMDIVAERLNMDPVEFRLQNILKPGTETTTGQTLVSSVGAEETILKAAKASRWKEVRNAPQDRSRYRTGIGLAISHYGNCLGAAGWFMDGAGVKISIHRDGSVSVAFGLVEMGQGALTVVTQMTAEALGIHPDRITVLPTRSDQVPDSGPAVASRNVVMTGNAILNAAEKLMPMLKKAAARLFESDPDSITIRDDRVTDETSGTTISFSELADFLYLHNEVMEEQGWWHVPELKFQAETGRGEAYFTYSYATHVAKVTVDTLTGKVRVDQFWAAHDVGKVINPAGLEGQVEGGVVQGIGWTLTEDFKFDNGKVVTDNLSTYLLPTTADIPSIETIMIEDAEPEGPWGAKGIGEPAIIPTAAAVVNAVSHAVGKSVNELPATPERILNRISED